MADFEWTTGGGVLMDSTGDISISSGFNETQDLVITRMKASLEDWQMYSLSADLESRIGDTITSALQLKLQRQVSTALSDILSPSQYSIKTLVIGNTIQIYIFVNGNVIVTAAISSDSVSVTGT